MKNTHKILEVIESFQLPEKAILSISINRELLPGGNYEWSGATVCIDHGPWQDELRGKFQFTRQFLLERAEITAHHLDGGTFQIAFVLTDISNL